MPRNSNRHSSQSSSGSGEWFTVEELEHTLSVLKKLLVARSNLTTFSPAIREIEFILADVASQKREYTEEVARRSRRF